MPPPMELTDIEIQQIKEYNQKRVKRVVAIVAITMTIISIVLVGISLSLGNKIDRLVEEATEKRHAAAKDVHTALSAAQKHS